MARCKHWPERRKQKDGPKHYGSKRIRVWCDLCDAYMVIPPGNKKRARQAGKRDLIE